MSVCQFIIIISAFIQSAYWSLKPVPLFFKNILSLWEGGSFCLSFCPTLRGYPVPNKIKINKHYWNQGDYTIAGYSWVGLLLDITILVRRETTLQFVINLLFSTRMRVYQATQPNTKIVSTFPKGRFTFI